MSPFGASMSPPITARYLDPLPVSFWGRIWNARKSIIAALGAGWTAFAAIVASLPAGEGINAITLSGWMLVASAVLGTTGFVYTLPNKALPIVSYTTVPDTITLPDISDASTGDSEGPVSLPDLSDPTVEVSV